MSALPSHDQVLPRFVEIARALRAQGSFFDDWTMLQLSALALPLVEGEPDELARAMRERMEELRRGAHWWKRLGGSLRGFVATSLLQAGEDAGDFYSELERVRALFRRAKLPRGSVSETLGYLILRDLAPQGRVTAESVLRMGELYREIKRDHRWLLGAGEYPTLALLSACDTPPAEIARRVEKILQRLEAQGFRSRGRLIPIAQLLFLAPEADAVVTARFEALWKEFQARGLRMFASDYDEVALLCFAPRPAKEIVRRVLEHRAELCALKPRPGRDISFSLACATAFLELVGADPKLRRISKTQAALQVRSILAARQAAAASAAS